MKSWINRERFPNYSKVDSFTLYAMGDSGNFTAVLSAATCGTKPELLVVLAAGGSDGVHWAACGGR